MQPEALNPILKGFNPDPSICRKGDDFYIATSSFQWWPGVPIYHSRDLVNWRLITYGLTNPAHCNLERIGDSSGIWAPSLTYADGRFWLVFTIASGSRLHSYETFNYLTTAREITGPWTEPVYLNATGNDPSLFHDDDGRKYILNSDFQWDPGSEIHSGTVLQEYSAENQKLTGRVKNIFRGTDLGVVEGSKMYKRNGWYYLGIAEGGTSFGHAMTLVRSRNIWGPYEVHPRNPILTATGDPDNPIQKAGHGDIVTLNGDRVAVVYLASRPINKKCMLGRETFIAGARWGKDDWLQLDDVHPRIRIPDFGLEEHKQSALPEKDDFNEPSLKLYWNSLRSPVLDRIDLESRPGWLSLKPGVSRLDSFSKVSMIARRIQHHQFTAELKMEYQPSEPQQWAGLSCYYDTRHWYFLHRQFDMEKGAQIALYSKTNNNVTISNLGRVSIPDERLVRFGVDCDGTSLRFRFRLDGKDWENIGEPQDALILSDDYIEWDDPVPNFAFTGAFVGLAASDITERGPNPQFDWFDYIGKNM